METMENFGADLRWKTSSGTTCCVFCKSLDIKSDLLTCPHPSCQICYNTFKGMSRQVTCPQCKTITRFPDTDSASIQSTKAEVSSTQSTPDVQTPTEGMETASIESTKAELSSTQSTPEAQTPVEKTDAAPCPKDSPQKPAARSKVSAITKTRDKTSSLISSGQKSPTMRDVTKKVAIIRKSNSPDKTKVGQLARTKVTGSEQRASIIKKTPQSPSSIPRKSTPEKSPVRAPIRVRKDDSTVSLPTKPTPRHTLYENKRPSPWKDATHRSQLKKDKNTTKKSDPPKDDKLKKDHKGSLNQSQNETHAEDEAAGDAEYNQQVELLKETLSQARLYDDSLEKYAGTLVTPTALCGVHNKNRKPLLYFCRRCDARVCADCITEGHVTDDHEVVVYTEYRRHLLRKKLNDLRGARQRLAADLKVNELGLERTSRSLHETERDLNQRAHLVKEELCQKIDSIRDKCLNRVRTFHVEQDGAINHDIRVLTTALSNVETTLKEGQGLQNLDEYLGLDERHTEVRAECDRVLEASVIQPLVNGVDDIRFKVGHVDVSLEAAFGEVTLHEGALTVESQKEAATTSELPAPRYTYVYKRKVMAKNVFHFQVHDMFLLNDLDFDLDELVLAGRMDINNTQRLLRFTLDGQLQGHIEHDIAKPWQISISQGHIFLTDTTAKCVKKLNMDGRVVNTYKAEVKSPGNNIGLAVCQEKLYFSLDDTNPTIFCCDLDTGMVKPLKIPVKLQGPVYLAVNPQQDLLISDNQGHCLYCLDTRHGGIRFKYGTGKAGSGTGQLFYPMEICCDRLGQIYIADYSNHRVVFLAPDGKFVSHVASQQKHGIEHPRCVKVDQNGEVMVVAHSANRVLVLSGFNCAVRSRG